MPHPRVQFEEQLMSCWQITEEIEALCEGVFDGSQEMTNDSIANILIGLQELYNLKFDKLFSMFEHGDADSIHNHERVIADVTATAIKNVDITSGKVSGSMADLEEENDSA